MSDHHQTTRADSERLLRAFYRDAAMDDLLGPIFEAAQVDWPSHTRARKMARALERLLAGRHGDADVAVEVLGAPA